MTARACPYPGLLPDVYRANVSKQGFKSEVKDGIELHVGDQVGLNFTLQVGAVSENVTVQSGEPLVKPNPPRWARLLSASRCRRPTQWPQPHGPDRAGSGGGGARLHLRAGGHGSANCFCGCNGA